MPGPSPRLPARWEGSALVVTLPARLDESNASLIRGQLLAAVNRQPRALIADMSATAWCDWAGAGVIASVLRQARAVGTDLKLVVADDYIRRVLTLNGLDRLMYRCHDPSEALPNANTPPDPAGRD